MFSGLSAPPSAAFAAATPFALPTEVPLGDTAITTAYTQSFNLLSVHASASGRYLVASKAGVGIWVSNNFGATFTRAVSGTANYYITAVSPSGQCMYCSCTANNLFYHSTDYGATWASTTVGTGGNLSFCTCDTTGQYVWVTDYAAGTLYESANYGASFGALVAVGANANIANILYHAATNAVFFTSMASGKMYRYARDTSTLTTFQPNGGSTNCSGVDVSSDGTRYVLSFYPNTSGQIYVSADSGASWTAVTLGSGSTNNVERVGCSPSGKYVYAQSVNLVFRSNNYGAAGSWTSIDRSAMFNNPGFVISKLNLSKTILMSSSANAIFALSHG